MSCRPLIRRGLLQMMLALAAGAAGFGGAAHGQESIEREIARSEERLEQIRAERAALRAEMTVIRGRVSDLAGELSNLVRQHAASASLLEESDRQLARREEQIGRNRSELARVEARLSERQAALHGRMRDLYIRGPQRTFEVLLAAESFSDLIQRYRYLVLIARHDRKLLDEVARLEHDLVLRQGALQIELDRLHTLREEQKLETELLLQLEREQERALRELERQEATTATRIERLEEDESRISALLARLDRERMEARAAVGAVPGSSGATSAPLAGATLGPQSAGRVAWPLEGRVIYEFGRSTEPNGTIVRWNGIGIDARPGTPVLAVAGGEVVLAGPFEGYGPTVILSHGAGYYTLYLYLGELEVKEGEVVSAGQVLGRVGGPSRWANPHLEFQIRVPGGEAVDPRLWLQGR